MLRAILALTVALIAPAAAGERFAGPVEARVLDVIDGDTLKAEALLWPGHRLTVSIRIRGIDAPEMKSRCHAERLAAQAARDELARLIAGGTISVSNVAGAKYYGRVLADVATPDGRNIAPAMLSMALVRPYGGGRRGGWC